MSSVSHYYWPDNAIVGGLDLFESTRIVDIPVTSDNSTGYNQQVFIGVPKNGAIISCGYNVSFTTWHDDYQIRKQGEYTDYGIDIGFDKESEQLQLSVYMGGYGRRDTYDNGQTDVTGQKREYSFVGSVSDQRFDGIDRIFIKEYGDLEVYGKAGVYVQYAPSAIAQPYRSMTYHYVSRTKLKNKIEYTAKIASDYFSKDDSGFDGLSIDTGYRFFELFNKGFYFLCDVSGNIVNPSYDRISSDSYSSYPRWYSQPHYYGKISVGLAGEDAEQLSSDPVLNWMFESGEDNVWANATPFQRFRNRVMHIYSNIQPDSSDSMGNNKLGQPIPKMLDQFDNGIREVTGDLAVALTAIDAASLQGLRHSLSAVHPDGYQFAGFIGLKNRNRISSVFDENAIFLKSIPFERKDGGQQQPLEFMTTHNQFFPVFIQKEKCVLNLFGADEELFRNNYANYKEHILDVAFNPNVSVLSCETLSANTYAGFAEKAKECAKYETAFINVFAHGDRRAGGEGTAIRENGGWVLLESDIMRKILNGISKNVVYRSTCCFGAGTLMNPFVKHAWPNQFLPGMTGRIRSDDGKSIMYVVNDVSTSPAWATGHRYVMFSDVVMAQCVGTDITYGQFVDKFNSLVKRCKQSIFRNLRELFKQVYDSGCLFAKLPDGTEITNKEWRRQAVAEMNDVWEDMRTFGTKYALNYHVDENGKEVNAPDTVFWKLYCRIANPPKGMCSFSNFLKNAFEKFDDELVGNDQAYERLKGDGYYKDVLFSIGLNLGAKAITRLTAKSLKQYYEQLLADPQAMRALEEEEKNYPFRNSELVLAKVAYDAYSVLDLFDMIAMSKVKDSFDAYNAAVDRMIGILVNGFYKTYREAKEIIMSEIGDGVLVCQPSMFSMIFLNLVIDWPAAGFFKVTPEFENRKFMT